MEELKSKLEEAKLHLILKESNGGKLLIKELQDDISSSVTRLITTYKKAQHHELIATIAFLEAKTAMLDNICSADNKVESFKQEIKEYEKENK